MGLCGSRGVSRAKLDSDLVSSKAEFASKFARKVTGLGKERFLGQGSFGKVVLVEERATKDTFALKMIVKRKRSGGDSKLLESLRTEITILRRCGAHENVLRLVDAFDTPTRVLLVMELATGGDLLGWATSGDEPFSARHAASATVQILRAVAFLHDTGIVHRDIKPDNVLVRDRASFVIKVADFGCSKILSAPIGAPSGVLSEDNILPDRRVLEPPLNRPARSLNLSAAEFAALMETYVGTKVYAAPEILRHEPYDATVDEYSTGILLALLLTGTHPLSDVEMDTNLALASCDVAHLIDFRHPMWETVPPDAVAVVRCLANTDPGLRLTAAEALGAFKWLTDFETLADDAPLGRDVLQNLRKVHVDQVQALALRLATSTGARIGDEAYDTFVATADALFDRIDADATGLIRRAELSRAAQGNGLDAACLAAAFDNADLDGTGVLSRDELRAALLATHHDLLDSLLLVAFDRMDVSKTGTISRQDIIDAASSLGIKRLNLKDVASWIAAHDEAGDGVLSFAEFKRMMARLEI